MFIFNLLKWNALLQQSEINLLRPILYSNESLLIYKGYEKKINSLACHYNTNNYQSDQDSMLDLSGENNDYSDDEILLNKQTLINNELKDSNLKNYWQNLIIPNDLFKRLNFDLINVTSSFDGKNIVLTNGRLILIYSFFYDQWCLYMDEYNDTQFNITGGMIWWENSYLFVGNNSQFFNTNDKNFKSQLLMFNISKVYQTIENNKFDNSNIDKNDYNYDTDNFNVNSIIWKYDFNDKISYINIDRQSNELFIVLRNFSVFIFKLKQKTLYSKITEKSNFDKLKSLYKKQVLINLRHRFSLKYLFNKNEKFENVIKVNEEINDLLILCNNGNLYYLKYSKFNDKDISKVNNENEAEVGVGSIYEKFLLFNNIEYFKKVKNGVFYIYNGDEILYLDNFEIFNKNENENKHENKGNYKNSLSILEKINSLFYLKISNDTEQFYPILMSIDSKNFSLVGIEIDIFDIKNDYKILKQLTKRKFFLSDLIDFEIDKLIKFQEIDDKNMDLSRIDEEIEKYEDDLDDIIDRYKNLKNVEYSLEIILYKMITKFEEKDYDNWLKLKLILTMISDSKNLINEISNPYNIIAKCLRKVETVYWKPVFKTMKKTPKDLFDECILMKDYKTAGYFLMIFLNFKTGINGNENSNVDKLQKEDEDEILKLLEIIVNNLNSNDGNGKDSELWEMGIEIIRFLKVLDSSGEILEKSIARLES
ncbi:Ric1p ASCRUDRAFT_73736 [Ascoidea rubescens DSM 1968]|uniref:RIC1 C-terminal alpha solenoid region domain-containing protein n=1 Tax=Ascoidea rubescens DSM 1968 TaxID=1344418 RepID=A0A1D2VQX4_9ASCO|nr:hypothetical protein ASCRUDRAFT_73736 [Ascoidea rubescens DSM 1968]ODV64016.1 hypothetical protein ASCRUDRAFT_73736 [Ascoidea rubescens DSM 1968]